MHISVVQSSLVLPLVLIPTTTVREGRQGAHLESCDPLWVRVSLPTRDQDQAWHYILSTLPGSMAFVQDSTDQNSVSL